MSECVFCKIARKEIPSKIVYEDGDVVAFEDLKPKAPLHVLLIPKSHVERVSELDPGKAAIASKLVLAANKIAREKGVDKTGYRLVINCGKDAGQEVFHLHLHLMAGRKFTWPPG
jgi:histidine triad (HIT) family protein